MYTCTVYTLVYIHMYMYIHCMSLQGKYHVDPNYMSKQSQVNSKMRAILIDWLIQVHLRFTLLQETLYLTISVIDRYLQVTTSVCVCVCVCVCVLSVEVYIPHTVNVVVHTMYDTYNSFPLPPLPVYDGVSYGSVNSSCSALTFLHVCLCVLLFVWCTAGAL